MQFTPDSKDLKAALMRYLPPDLPKKGMSLNEKGAGPKGASAALLFANSLSISNYTPLGSISKKREILGLFEYFHIHFTRLEFLFSRP